MTDMNKRRYRMTERAATVERTTDRILDAALRHYAVTPYVDLRLDDLAADAQVTVQTLVRRFGGKAGLIVALVERELGRLAAARAASRGAAVPELIGELVAHYERYGDLILKLYGEAPLVPGLAERAAEARAFHVDWCRQRFGALVAPASGPETDRRIAAAVAVCDATTWRILRRDGNLEPAEVELTLRELLAAALGAPPDPHEDAGQGQRGHRDDHRFQDPGESDGRRLAGAQRQLDHAGGGLELRHGEGDTAVRAD